MKKIIEFIKNVFWIFRRKKIVDFVEYETPLMLNKKYLEKISGRKKKIKNKLKSIFLKIYFDVGVNVIGLPETYIISIFKEKNYVTK